jgi:Peptidase family M28
MSTRPRFSERRRPRPGSLDRPVNGRMYRGTWLLVGIPLLIAAFTVARPQPLRAPTLPPAFEAEDATVDAQDFSREFPIRTPGTPRARDAADHVAARLGGFGLPTEVDRFHVEIPGHGRVQLENVIARRRGPQSTSDAIVVMAHRDNTGAGPGANDNASGTAALLELARAYAAPAAPPRPPDPNHTIVFLSTDGGAFGALGADHFARSTRWRDRVVAVVNLDAIAGDASPRLEVAGDRSRAADPALVRTAANRVLEQTGREPRHASALGQLIDLAFPFSLYEHAPFVGRGIPALTLTTAGTRPPPAFGDTPERLNGRRLGEIGRSAQALLTSLDEEVELVQGTSSYVYLGARSVRGWAIVFILCAALLPCLAVIVDLFARLRRRRIPLAAALRSFRSRLAFWLFAGVLFQLFALLGIWGTGAARPVSPEDSPGTDWPLLALAVFTCFLVAAWLLARQRLVPRRRVTLEEELAGHTAALLGLAIVALLVVATNPYALIFVLPSLHAWLWLPQVRRTSTPLAAAILAAGLIGPALLVISFATRLELGFDAPWYLAELAAVGYIPFPSVLIFCGWLAVAAQLSALTAGRYAPYPGASERPPAGPLRTLAHRVGAGVHERRREWAERRAVGG